MKKSLLHETLVLLLGAALASLAGLSHAGEADLDTTFGSLGVTQVCSDPPFTTSFCTITPSVIAKDGSGILYAARTFSTGRGSSGESGTLGRLRADGTVDASFVPAFSFTADSHGVGLSEAAQADGRIVAAFLDLFASGSYAVSLSVVRMNADGSADPAFATAGKANVNVGDFKYTVMTAMQSNGRIVVGGLLRDTGQPFAVRFLSNGALDMTYGANGIAWSPLVGASRSNGATMAMALQPDDRVVFAWFSGNLNDPVVVSRFDPNGQPDASFHAIGQANVSALRSVAGITVQPDGGVVVAGNGITGWDSMVRLLADGTLDASFGTGGVKETTDRSSISAIVSAPDGRIYGTGQTGDQCELSRWLPDGTDDTSFHPNGHVTWGVGSNCAARSLALQPDGKVVLAYTVGGYPNGSAWYIARFGSGTVDIFGDSGLFVRQQYLDFLGRAPDDGGLAFWRAQLDTGPLSRAQVVDRFLASQEFQGRIAPIARLYFAYFLRYPDYVGLQYWLGQYLARSLADISNLFAASAEFGNRYGALDNSQFVTRVYENVLGREPDAAGLAYWQGQLDSSTLTRGQVMMQFSEGAEYMAVSAHEVYVTMAYIGMLRREPDAAGFSYWASYMDAGHDGLALIDGFLASGEYQGRFLP